MCLKHTTTRPTFITINGICPRFFFACRVSTKDTCDYYGYEIRPLAKCEAKHFFVSAEIANVIGQSPLTKLLCRLALQAGQALNKLYDWDRITEIRLQCNRTEILYETFLKQIIGKMEQFRQQSDAENPDETTGDSMDNRVEICSPKDRQVEPFRNELLAENYLLYLSFEKSDKATGKIEPNAFSVYDKSV